MFLAALCCCSNTVYDAAVTKNSFPGWDTSNLPGSKIGSSH